LFLISVQRCGAIVKLVLPKYYASMTYGLL